MQIDHIGIAVKELKPAIQHYEKHLSAKLLLCERVEEQGVELAFLVCQASLPGQESSCLELLAPIDLNSGSLANFLIKRGPGLHHICYRVEDIQAELKRFAKSGFQLIDEIPRKGARNTKIAFIHPQSFLGVLTELCEYQK